MAVEQLPPGVVDREPDLPPVIGHGHTFRSVTDKISSIVLTRRTPPGWILKAAGGQIKGYATVGAGFISVDDLQDLDGLVLIKPHAGEPLGVSGKLLTGVYADDGGQSEVAATPALLRRDPADRCPPAKG